MIEVVTSLAMGGILTWVYSDKVGVKEGQKISKIAKHCGLIVRDGKDTNTIHCLDKRQRSWGTEYVYRIPLGLSFEDFQNKRQNFEDGLNIRNGLWDVFKLEDIKKLKWDKTLPEQIKKILTQPKGRKEVVMDYDGTLRIRVYKEPLAKKVDFTEITLTNCKGWKICIGEAREGTVYHDFEEYVHMIVAGTTRYGKSVFLKSAITTLIHNKPDHARLHLIDLKGGLAFQRFKETKQVRGVAKDAHEALEMLRRIEEEMKQRQVEFLSKGYEDITEASYRNRDFIIVDEAAELSPSKSDSTETKKAKAECEKVLSEIARIGGGLGYRLIYATQYPTSDVLPRQIKQNAPSKLCFLLDTAVASNVVLDEAGAENLPWIKGRAIYKTDRKTIVQSPLITNEFIAKAIAPQINIRARRSEDNEYQTGTENRPDTIKFEES